MAWNRDKERKAGKAMTIGSSIYGIVFMVIWCGLAAAMGAWFMLIFGIPMLGFMIFRLVVCIRKANEGKKERDPWDQKDTQRSYTQTTYTQPQQSYSGPVSSGSGDGFCPYCGEEVKEGFAFCPKCGRRLQ